MLLLTTHSKVKIMYTFKDKACRDDGPKLPILTKMSPVEKYVSIVRIEIKNECMVT